MSAAREENQVVIQPAGFTPLKDGERGDDGGGAWPRRAIIITALALFALAILFLSQAQSIHIQVLTQNPADISIKGIVLPLGQRFLALPGDYSVHISAAGYEPLDTTLAVSEAENQNVEFALYPLPGRLTIASSPSGAAVSIDGEKLGVTPTEELQLSSGEHELLLENSRHLPLRQTLRITGRNIHQRLQLTMLPAWAEVTVSSAPAGAEVWVDEESMGTTPARLDVLQGAREMVLRKAGYADSHHALSVEAGTTIALGEINLTPAAGSLELDSEPGGANVTLDGEFMGQTPLLLELSPGTQHQLSVSRTGYRRHTESIELSAGSSRQHKVSLQALLGAVNFTLSPPEAQLRINGKLQGRGSVSVSLPALEHVAEISLPGYATVKRRFTPRPGLKQQISVNLQTPQEILLARIKQEVKTPLGQRLLLFNPAASPLPEFTMGASRREPGRRSNEVMRRVALKRMFYLQEREVTNAEFRAFQADHNSSHVQGRSLNRERQPAVQLSWQQAASYCNWLSRKQGLPLFYREKQGIIVGYNPASNGYRLPTEAEWAWAARSSGEQLLTFPWGDTFPPTRPVENYADKASAFITGRVLNNYTDEHAVSAPAASYSANQHGLYDMGGNVAEWVHDVYTIEGSNEAVTEDPMGKQSGDNYVIRGASWSRAKLPDLRLARRDYGQAGRDDVGFRLARYAE